MLTELYAPRATLCLDSGEGGALLMATGHVPAVRVPMNNRGTPNLQTAAELGSFIGYVRNMLLRFDADTRLTPDWQTHFIILTCQLPDLPLNPANARPPLHMLIEQGRVEGDATQPVWAIAVDSRYVWLARTTAEKAANLLQAAAGRMAP